MSTVLKLIPALLPLLLTVLFAFLLMEGHISFGGGEKDIFLVVPLLAWSLVLMCCHLVLWWRKSPTGRSIAISAGVATGFVAVGWVILFFVSWFG